MSIIPLQSVVPKIAPDGFVAPNATVIGDVHIGSGSSIWFGAVIRGDVFHIRIGKGSNIQDNSVIHVATGRFPTVVGDGVTVGHRVILHGCTVEDGALVGMGSIVMDRAVVGRGTLVAAGALVPEGKVLPPGMLVMGSPARPIRPLTPEERAQLADAAKGYAELARTYAEQLGWGH